MFPPPGTVFDPDALVVLTAAYKKAVRGQAASLHETVAKRIIELASEGERDPDQLCHGALALSVRAINDGATASASGEAVRDDPPRHRAGLCG
jgi:hypothetical protein